MYRKFYHASTPTLLQLYKACIRPHLEYAALVWDPHQLGLIKCLENVQKFALKVYTKSWKINYGSMLASYNLTSLASRWRFLKLYALYQTTQCTVLSIFLIHLLRTVFCYIVHSWPPRGTILINSCNSGANEIVKITNAFLQ